jgi:hypothetical protein
MNFFVVLFHACRRPYVRWAMRHVPPTDDYYFELSSQLIESDRVVGAYARG